MLVTYESRKVKDEENKTRIWRIEKDGYGRSNVVLLKEKSKRRVDHRDSVFGPRLCSLVPVIHLDTVTDTRRKGKPVLEKARRLRGKFWSAAGSVMGRGTGEWRAEKKKITET